MVRCGCGVVGEQHLHELHACTRLCVFFLPLLRPLPPPPCFPRQGEVGFLLATELAARGLDILGVEAVVNYDCPAHLTSYLHR